MALDKQFPHLGLARAGQQAAQTRVLAQLGFQLGRIEAVHDAFERGAHAGNHAELVRAQIVVGIAHRRRRRHEATQAGCQQVLQCRVAIRRKLERVVFARAYGRGLGFDFALQCRTRHQQVHRAAHGFVQHLAYQLHEFRCQRVYLDRRRAQALHKGGQQGAFCAGLACRNGRDGRSGRRRHSRRQVQANVFRQGRKGRRVARWRGIGPAANTRRAHRHWRADMGGTRIHRPPRRANHGLRAVIGGSAGRNGTECRVAAHRQGPVERQVEVRPGVTTGLGAGLGCGHQRAQRIGAGGHIGSGGGIGQRRVVQGIARVRPEAEQRVQRIATRARRIDGAGLQPGNQRRGSGCRPQAQTQGPGQAWRRSGRFHRRREGVPVVGDPAQRRGRRGGRPGRHGGVGAERVDRCAARHHAGAQIGRSAQQPGQRIGAGTGPGARSTQLHLEQIRPHLQLIALGQTGLMAVFQGLPIDQNGVRPARNDGVAAAAEHHLGVHAGNDALFVGQYQLVALGAAQGSAQFIEGGAGRRLQGRAVEGDDGERDHG